MQKTRSSFSQWKPGFLTIPDFDSDYAELFFSHIVSRLSDSDSDRPDIVRTGLPPTLGVRFPVLWLHMGTNVHISHSQCKHRLYKTSQSFGHACKSDTQFSSLIQVQGRGENHNFQSCGSECLRKCDQFPDLPDTKSPLFPPPPAHDTAKHNYAA